MSWNPTQNPDCPNTSLDALETLIIPRARDLGGFEVRRALPSPKRQMVGPFIFFDQMGPAEFITDGGIDVRPHPHIGLGTVTYLYQGEFEHRDSLGTHQMIYPGEVNWMIAGNGVTHSERTSAETRATRHKLFGIQTWIALPEDREEMAPDFEHHKEAALPVLQDDGATASQEEQHRKTDARDGAVNVTVQTMALPEKAHGGRFESQRVTTDVVQMYRGGGEHLGLDRGRHARRWVPW